jgi:hypothetical protein
MTRQDFVLIAATIRNTREEYSAERVGIAAEPIATATLNALAANMARALDTTNPNFDRQRFLVACGCRQG